MDFFSKNFEVDYICAKPDLHTSFARLMEYVQEGSTAHTESTIYPMAWFAENMTGWIITNWHVEVMDYPKYGEYIRVETWPSRFKGILADRSFAIYNSDDKCILKAVSSWIYTDLIKRKPIRPNIEMIESYGQTADFLIDKDYKIPSIDLFEKIDEYNLSIKRRDIDTNYHVNNIKYIEWAQDGIPDEIYMGKNVIEMKTNYKKECSIGDEVDIITYQGINDKNEFITYVNKADKDNNNILLAEVYTKWG